MTFEDSEKIEMALNKIKSLPPRKIGGIYKDEIIDFAEMKKQKEFLTNLIITPPYFEFTNDCKICFPLKFNTIDNECSFGKSTVALQGILQYFREPSHRDNKIIWVSELTKDCDKKAQELNDLTNIENFAVSITTNIPRFLREEYLRKYQVIFITHERYKRLAREDKSDERETFKQGKQLLIIDEKINMQNTIEFCKTKNYELKEEIKKCVGKNNYSTAIKFYLKIVNPLLQFLSKTTKKDVIKKGIILNFKYNLNEVEKNIKKLKNIIEENVDDNLIYEDFENKDFQTIYEKIEDLKEFYIGRSIVDYMSYDENSNKKEVILLVPNYSANYWGLQKNIVLDATASIDLIYTYRSDIFNLIHQKNVFNHKYWNIHCLNVNSTTYGRTQLYTNFYPTVNGIIQEYGVDNFLVLANMYDDEEPAYKGSKERRKKNIFLGAVVHDGNFSGSNGFIDKTNYINADFLYENDRSYILKYLYYNRDAKIENWRSVNGKFVDEELEIFKIYEVARKHYQGLKRINRNMAEISNVFLLSHRPEITKIILDMLNGANVIKDIELEKRFIKVPNEKKEKEPKKINSFKSLCEIILDNEIPLLFQNLFEKEEFAKYKENAENGKFAKCLFYTSLEMTKESFRNNVLADKKGVIKKFMNEKGIVNSKGKYIIFPNFNQKK